MNGQNTTINAQPTKELFISMLIKDITLKDAIGDLVDNCVDGARRLQPEGNFNDLKVEIEITPESFKISDNCGGIPADVARNYAFRFGRPAEMPPTPYSVGQFGIGMKRALFKLGGEFRIESVSATSRFSVEIKVGGDDGWQASPDWEFEFQTVEEGLPEIPRADRSTIITVTSLHDEVADRFKLENFITELIQEIEFEHLHNIARGLEIQINGRPLTAPQLHLLQSSSIQVGFSRTTHNGLDVKSYVGISERNLDYGGWYIFCNERLVVGPEQSELSGWGAKEPTRIPKYHSQFDRFRGYIFFEAKDTGQLPWNTTKTSVDIDSPKFQAERQKMITMMRPVIDFMNRLHQEGVSFVRNEIEYKPHEETIEAAEPIRLSDIMQNLTTPQTFEAPEFPLEPAQQPPMNYINYRKPSEEVELVKDCLGVQTLKEVGERTFEYYLQMECQD